MVEKEQKNTINNSNIIKWRISLWAIIPALLLVICLLIVGIVKVGLEQQTFVDKCNAHWLAEMDRVCGPQLNLNTWNATPSGLVTDFTLGAAEKAGLNLTRP